MRRLLLSVAIAILLMLSLSIVHGDYLSVVGETGAYIFGVSTEANGTVVGVSAMLNLTITNGTGQVFLGSNPLVETDTQAQAVISTDVACQLLNINCNRYNFYYFITSQSPTVGGPSAGGAFAVLAMSVLSGKPPKSDVAMTGTANPDGSVGIVGDVSEKSEAAANQGIKVFLYPSTDTITAAAERYDSNLGMVTIPIDSVYQAFQYFTGFNASPTLSTDVYTGFFNRTMATTYQNFNAYQKVLNASIFSTSDAAVNSLVTAAQNAMKQEAILAAEGQYYVAASYIVNTSATDLVEASVLEGLEISNNQNKTIQGLLASEEAAISQTYSEITGNYLTNSSTLDLKFIALDRLSEASEFLNTSANYFASGPGLGVYYYALAEVKRVSSLFWVSPLPQGTSNFSESAYSGQAYYYLQRAASYQSYASLLGSSTSPSSGQLQDDYNSAQSYYNDGKFVSSIFKSIESISLAQLVIEENSIIDNSTAAIVEGQIGNSALQLINQAEKAGITPFLGISYYQLGSSYSNSSLSTEILYYSMSREYTTFEEQLSNAAIPSVVPLEQTAPIPIIINLTVVGYLILAFALGVVISGAIFEHKLARMLKRLNKAKKHGKRR